jgi:hypothetical protein
MLSALRATHIRSGRPLHGPPVTAGRLFFRQYGSY